MKKGIKKAQMQISFGAIFSVILIVIFIVVAFIVIRHFLDTENCVLIGNFYDKIAAEVDRVWKSQESDEAFSAQLPQSIEYVCFADMELSETGNNEEIKSVYVKLRKNILPGHNLFLYPPNKACNMASTEIKNINLQEITKSKNPYCIQTDGKINLRLIKDRFESYVMIK